MDNHRERVRMDLKDAHLLLQQGRAGASRAWLEAAESYVRLLQERLAAMGGDDPSGSGHHHPGLSARQSGVDRYR